MRVATCLLVAIAFAVVNPSSASAYCRATTCRDTVLCDGETPFDPACKTLAWKRDCVGIATQINASKDVPFGVADALITKAFQTWEEPVCDDFTAGRPNIHVTNMGPVDCNLVQYNSKGGNANILTFRDGSWPHPSGIHNIALTTVTFDTRTGEIYDADIEVNTAGFTITTTDTNVQTDLQSVLTHEAGHFLGLSHSVDANATMWANYTEGLIGQRTLGLDDIYAICAMYPPAENPVDQLACNPIPRHGFSPACLSEQTEGDCAVKSGVGSDGAPAGAIVMSVLAMIASAGRLRNRRERRRW